MHDNLLALLLHHRAAERFQIHRWADCGDRRGSRSSRALLSGCDIRQHSICVRAGWAGAWGELVFRFCRCRNWACLHKFPSLQTKNFAGEDVEAQTEQVMKNLGAILKAAGSDYSKVIKTTVLLESMDDFAKVNAIYGKQLLAQGLPPMHQLKFLLPSREAARCWTAWSQDGYCCCREIF